MLFSPEPDKFTTTLKRDEMAVSSPFFSAHEAPVSLAESLHEEHLRSSSAEWEALQREVMSVCPISEPDGSSELQAAADDIISNTSRSSRTSSNNSGSNSSHGNTGGTTPVTTQSFATDGYRLNASHWMAPTSPPAYALNTNVPTKSGMQTGSITSTGSSNPFINNIEPYLGCSRPKTEIWHYFPPEVVNGRYTRVNYLGQGRFTVVAQALQVRPASAAPNQPPRAVVIKRHQTLWDRTISLRALRELRILSRLRNHPNIIDLLDVRFDSEWNLYLVQPLMETDMRKLLNQLANNNELMDVHHVKRIMYQILCALKFVHSAKVIHRDVKPDNLLVNFAYGAYRVKLCDFGTARVDAFEPTSPPDLPKLTPQVSTETYGAPEVVLPNVWTYTRAVDIWSAGCILAELLGNVALFKCDEPYEQFGTIVQVLGVPSDTELLGILSRSTIDSGTRSHVERVVALKCGGRVPPRVVWRLRFPHADLDALVLLNEMLQYRPAARPRAEQLLERSDFLALYHEKRNEPTCLIPFTQSDMQIDGLQWLDIAEELKREVQGFHGGHCVDGAKNGGKYYGPILPVENRGARLPPQKQFYSNNNNSVSGSSNNYNNNKPTTNNYSNNNMNSNGNNFANSNYSARHRTPTNNNNNVSPFGGTANGLRGAYTSGAVAAYGSLSSDGGFSSAGSTTPSGTTNDSSKNTSPRSAFSTSSRY